MNPKIEVLMVQELTKLIQSQIVLSIKHNTLVSNLFLVQKKNGDIRLCVEFQDLNRASLKDHYPLPSMESILKMVARSEMFSLLDGFSGYNKIRVKEEDQHKTTFTTKWGTFTYTKMSFNLSNTRATFQRVMDIAFSELINKIILIYLDDLIVFSNSKDDHFDHLEMVFKKF